MEAWTLLLTSFITFSFFFLSSFPRSHSLPDMDYKECLSPFPCGNLTGVVYPFWSENIGPPYCGSPEFKLHCHEHDWPSIKIGPQTFNVTWIDPIHYKMKLVRTDFAYDNCSSHLMSSTSVSTPPTVFRYDEPNVKNVTLFYDCPTGIGIYTNKFTCQPGTSSNPNNYAFFREDAGFSDLNGKCKHQIEVPVSNKPDSQALPTALGKEFDALYDVGAGSCASCFSSKGICVSNQTSPFTCYCGDGPHPLNCYDFSGSSRSSNPFSLKNKVILAAVTAAFVVIVMLTGFFFYRRRKKTSYAKSYIQSHGTSSVSSMTMDPEINASKYFGVPVFTYTELEEATNNFDEARELGDGGFGTVYFGKLRDGRCVAVKRLYENNYKRVEQFINEVQILTRLRHTNLVSLYGCTSRHSRELLLVYEYIPNGTVADHLHGNRAKPGSLPWNIRMNIAVETASALAYLHASDIIHRDVKTNNILLDNHFVVKVADFGLSRLFPDHVTHVSTAPQGTPGYVDPEYHECYKLTDKSDVYSFGVVLIELISSLPAVDITRHRHEINLSTMAINKIQNRALHELVDPTLGFESDQKVRKMINAVAELAFQCLQNLKDMRPSMEEVLETLRDIESDGKHKSTPEVMNISDDVGLLKNDLPPPSPDSNLASKSTTSNSSS